MRFETLADFREVPADTTERERLVHATVAQYVQRLEALCLEAPYNWFNFYDYWNEDTGHEVIGHEATGHDGKAA